MRFALLARSAGLYSHQRIIMAAQSRGHDIEVINTLRVHMNITANRPVLRYGGQALPMELRWGVAYDAELLAEVRRQLGEGLVEMRLATN